MNNRSHHSRRVVLALVVAAVIALVWVQVERRPARAQQRRGPSVVAVDAAVATRRDVPVYLQGLGTVQAYNTARITTRVDGELQSVDFKEGQMVKKGQLLAQIDPRPMQAALAEAVATKAKDTAQLANARDTLKRYEQLAPANLASKETIDSQRALVQQLQAQIQADQAVIDNARTQLAYTRITSPITGRTGIRLIDPGNIVQTSNTTGIVVVTQVQPIAVIFTLPEDDLLEVRQALAAGPVHVTASARDGSGEILDRGKVELIDNEIDQATGTMRVKAIFPNVKNSLWPGQFVSVSMLARIEHDVVTVPTEAIQRGPNGQFAYLIKPDHSVVAQPLRTGEEYDQDTVVTSGLKAGEMVVTTNQLRLAPGLHVHVISIAGKVSGPPAAEGDPGGA